MWNIRLDRFYWNPFALPIICHRIAGVILNQNQWALDLHNEAAHEFDSHNIASFYYISKTFN